MLATVGSKPDQDKGKRKLDDEPVEANKQRRSRASKFNTYTDLTHSLEQIYAQTRGQIRYEAPSKRDGSVRERSTGKYCIYHEQDGHTTDECRRLRDLVETYVRCGRLCGDLLNYLV